MEQTIKLAVIGGTGKSGRYLVNELLHQGFAFKLLLRNPENFAINTPLIEVVKGDARDSQAVTHLLEGCQAVISTLGQPKGESSIFSQATAKIISAMESYDIHRYIVITGLNVDTPFDQKSAKTKSATEWMKTNYPETTFDRQKEYELLIESNLDWTLVRLPLIELTDQKSEVTVSLEDCIGNKISATDLAIFLINQLEDKSYIRKSPFIFNL